MRRRLNRDSTFDKRLRVWVIAVGSIMALFVYSTQYFPGLTGIWIQTANFILYSSWILDQLGVDAMINLSIQVPETIFSALRKDPVELAQEMKVAAAVKWYELGEISQGKAAELVGLNRAEFINILYRYQVSPFQYSVKEVFEEIENVD